MITLHLARHGNTFSAGQTPVYAGTRNDLPLVAEGEAQAQRFAAFCLTRSIVPSALLHSRLQRTRRFAEIVGAALGLAPRMDARLDEIDYGHWTGLSTEVLYARFGRAAHQAWEEHGQWPPVPEQWAESETDATARVASFLQSVAEGAFGTAPLAISSQGTLRVMLRVDAMNAARLHARQAHKVKTGHYGCLVKAADWRVLAWNLPPEA